MGIKFKKKTMHWGYIFHSNEQYEQFGLDNNDHNELWKKYWE